MWIHKRPINNSILHTSYNDRMWRKNQFAIHLFAGMINDDGRLILWLCSQNWIFFVFMLFRCWIFSHGEWQEDIFIPLAWFGSVFFLFFSLQSNYDEQCTIAGQIRLLVQWIYGKKNQNTKFNESHKLQKFIIAFVQSKEDRWPSSITTYQIVDLSKWNEINTFLLALVPVPAQW